ncbi:3-hydroxyacyl-CoA dehydrogenase [Brachybacterium sillae]|uniref:3-hydroxyacyl-CoA dehydrogenase n=1 Tax=Brachybacterium sillae TaxID=2810536 RepID=UPI00217DCF57|nr:3-hydroxyacyl-CoA dehydrogenase [Brachybacterium sillae]
MSTLQNLTVLGSGVLGSQIIMQAAYAGKDVVAYDVTQEFLDALPERYEWLRGQYRRDLEDFSEERFEEAIRRIRSTTDLADALQDADVVVEAVPEKLDLKKQVWAEVGEKAPEKTLFATNTSSLLPSDFMDATGRPERFTTLHFANLVWLHNTGEVMRTPKTSDETFERVISFAAEINLIPIALHKEQPGYVLNSLAIPWLDAAQSLFARGIAEPEDIDTVWQVATGMENGPFAALDIIGLETSYNITSQSEHPDVRAFADLIKRDYIDQGKTGVAAGEGFYRYDADGRRVAA